MIETVLAWLPYWILGLAGILTHIITKLGKGESIIFWIRNNFNDFALSLIGFHLVVFFWVDTGLEILGLLKNTPTGMIFMIGYFGNSILSNLVKQYEKRIQKIE